MCSLTFFEPEKEEIKINSEAQGEEIKIEMEAQRKELEKFLDNIWYEINYKVVPELREEGRLNAFRVIGKLNDFIRFARKRRQGD